MNTQSGNILKIIGSIIMGIVIVTAVISVYGGGTESSAIEEAEKYANNRFYSTYGFVADKMTSDVIYKSGADKLITVKFYYDNECLGVCCVHTSSGSVVQNCSTIMMPNYDFEENLSNTKALFGL